MKKIMLIGFAFSLLATNAFATDITSAGGVGTNTVLQGFKTSKQVVVAVNALAQSYGVAADHLNGTRVYGSISGDPLIYFIEKTPTEIGTNVASTKLSTIDGSVSTALSSWASL